MRRNLDLENWLIETTGEEMMANHLGPNWNRFNDDVGFYPSMTMTVADQVWQHQQSKVDELQLKLSEDSRILHNVIEIERKKNDELQKRVDAAQKVADKMVKGTISVSMFAYELEQALKGGEA